MTTVLVTGSSSGIGEACARRLSRHGHLVYAGVRTEADADRLRRAMGPAVVPVLLDVTCPDQIEEVARRLETDLGGNGLGGLVNNAGIARGGPIEVLELEEWRAQLEVNVIGQVAVTRAMIPLLRRGHGRIVFMGSMFGRVATPFIAPYSASKFALEAIGESLREELRPWDIAVSVVEPGVIRTPIWEKSRAYTTDFVDRASAEALRLYGDAAEHMKVAIDAEEEVSISPDRVADAVEHALTSHRPHYRYQVGKDAKAAGMIERFLPDRAAARVVARLSP
jgi:NAD(P)-dependent dehydrogenase (short-subunit alcohol dehydrogenase family)